MITKKRITTSIDEDILAIFMGILKDEGIKTSFAVNMLIKDFVKLYQGVEDEQEE